MKICFFPSDFSGPGMYRCAFPGQELTEQFGHETFIPETKEIAPNRYGYQLKKIPYADVYVLQQRPEPEWFELIPKLKARGRKIVCETDDYYLGIPPGHPAFEATQPYAYKQKLDGLYKFKNRSDRNNLNKIYAMADVLTVSTPFLARAYSRFNANVQVLPNYLEESMWQNLPEKNWDRLRIGWFGVSSVRMNDMRVLQGLIGSFLRKHPEVDFVAAGDGTIHELLDIPEKQRITYTAVEFFGIPGLVSRMDIGLIPLELNDFNQAKSHLKGMEYNACGIPFAASPSESYLSWTEEGVNGFLAKRPKDWLRHLERLVEDTNLREQMSKAARAKAMQNTIQKHAHKWNDLYSDLAGDWADAMAREAIHKAALQKPSELSAFLRHIEGMNPQVVVEIGTASGGMFWALCQMAADGATVISLDLPEGAFGGVARDEEKLRSYAKPGQSVHFIDGDSRETKPALERILNGKKIDLLFIDGDHTYEGVKSDYELYSPLAKTVVLHDILVHPKVPECEVHRLWAELPNKQAEFIGDEELNFGRWGGIGVAA